MRDPRQGIDPTTLLIAAAIGLVLWLVAGALFAQALPAGNTLDPRAALEISQRAIGRPLGDHTLVGGDGEPVRLASYRGAPLLVSFIYTGCAQVCPATTQFLGRAVEEAQRALGKDAFNVVTVGFNLPFDSPAAMRDFRKRQGIDLPRWAFLAGDPPTIDALARDVGFVWIPTGAGFDHLTQVTIVDAQGRVVRQVYGESFELPMLVGPLKELLSGEAARTFTLENVWTKVKLYCTVYDPYSGGYRLNYSLFVELFAGFTFVVAVVWWMWRERPRARI